MVILVGARDSGLGTRGSPRSGLATRQSNYIAAKPALEVALTRRLEWYASPKSRAPTMSSLADILARETREGELYDVLPDGRLRCYACGHQCPLPEGAVGICKVRFNEGGRLRVPWGYVGGVQCDPIEKKPFFHAYPGALAYSFGMLGCDLHCGYCQNWV